MEKKTIISDKKEIDPKELTTCESTAQMITKARIDGVSLQFDRAADMKACPIGKDSACCKHCAMGPCRLNAKDPYGKVGVCGATIDTIMARNFGRMVAAGTACHNDHGMAMLELFRDVVNGEIDDYSIKDPIKLEEVAASVDEKLPACGTPCRDSISSPEQHIPTRFMPLAPACLAASTRLGSCTEAIMDSNRLGSCPWTIMLTWSSLRTPILTSMLTGEGVPNRISPISVATMDPPQPSTSAVRLACLVMLR